MAIKLYFAVVDMAGEPGMAEVEHPEDCYEEDAYVRLADYDVQTARIKELEAELEAARKVVKTATAYLPHVSDMEPVGAARFSGMLCKGHALRSAIAAYEEATK